MDAPLLRNEPKALSGVADMGDSFCERCTVFVLQADSDFALVLMNEQPSHSAQEGQPTGDRLPMVLSVLKTDLKVPPVVDQRDQIGHQSAGSQLLRREAVPTQLVFELIVDVLGIGSFPIKTR